VGKMQKIPGASFIVEVPEKVVSEREVVIPSRIRLLLRESALSQAKDDAIPDHRPFGNPARSPRGLRPYSARQTWWLGNTARAATESVQGVRILRTDTIILIAQLSNSYVRTE
jgi:hypothetical protein